MRTGTQRALSLLLATMICGCDRTPSPAPPTAEPDRVRDDGVSNTPVPSTDWDAQVQQAGEDPASATAFIDSLDLEQSDQRAAGLTLVDTAIKNDRDDIAEAALNAILGKRPTTTPARRTLWRLLQRQGRCLEASRHADVLCLLGQAGHEELISLVRRNEVFPVPKDGNPPADFVNWTSLRKAKWLLAGRRYSDALDILAKEAEIGFSSPAAAATYLRLLSEQQRWSDFAKIHREHGKSLQRLADYWCAVGQFLIDHGEYKAAAGALLQAIEIDPTMRIAFQRLSRCMKALDRDDDAQQFRHLGLQIASSETIGRRLEEDPTNVPAMNDLAQLYLAINRPLEALEWTRLTILPRDTAKLALVARRRSEVAATPDILRLPATTALLGLDKKSFPIREAFGTCLRSASAEADSPGSEAPTDLLAPRLVNVASEKGLDFQWYHDAEIKLDAIPLYESVGGGIGVLDFDLDGWPDVYFAQGGCPPPQPAERTSELRRNLGGTFTDVTQLSLSDDTNYSSGIAAGDVNQDGFTDLFLGAQGKNRLLINNGDGTFRDATETLGEVDDRITTSVAIADIDGDRIPDLFEVNYVEYDGAFREPEKKSDGSYELPSPLLFYADADRWYRSDGNASFSVQPIGEDTAQPGTGLGIVITDFDGRPGNEVFVGNDLRENHYFKWIDDALVNLAPITGVASGHHGLANGCMGIATGDFDRDGNFDMHIGNYREESDNLFLQRSVGTFTDLSTAQGLRDLTLDSVTFGSKTLDFDGNGWLDLIVTNGHIFDMRHLGQGYKMRPALMMSTGRGFVPMEVDDPSEYWQGEYLGRTMVMTDYNRDGRTDFVIGHIDAPTALLENQTNANHHHVMLEFVGTRCERDAIGTKVVVESTAGRVTQWVTAGDGYFGTDESYLDISVGAAEKIESIEVTWPGGSRSTFRDSPADRRYLIIEGQDQLVPRMTSKKSEIR